MDNKEKARITYELLQQRKKRREKGKKDAVNYMLDQIFRCKKESSKVIKQKYRDT